ncbi:NAD(P)/FAD-dependent oxidoreductase [Methylovirgula sp. 4M-Z18]|uniref:NAD(P)/FAD-dependent oxidoreductase n=1 Tax=Methylovirgula sp. 4M-Z18 TaxID=2293567 RepID=UPI000E2F7E50|nr:FAD-binding oxidoreductase [Methylovirgula sp. 4M-Z18]RFB79747.1 FAD-binding oxidoreductase [Methylovirgula sp. 4M-Z18]
MSGVVKRLPVNAGTSGWEAISTRNFAVRTLDGDVLADWLIVGAGFAGLSAARRLTQLRPGEKIVVLDAGDVAKGTAGRNSGYMIDVPHNLSSGEYSVADAQSTASEIAQNRLAIAFAADAAAEYGMSKGTFDPSGKINAAATPRGLTLNENYRTSLSRIGEKCELLDKAQMRAITGSEYYLGGLYTPGAVMIQPADYIFGLVGGLGSKIELYERSPVLELNRRGAHWQARSNRGTITAPKVILGVNGHIQSFGHFQHRLMHIFTYASMTAAYAQQGEGGRATGAERWALLPSDPMGATVRKICNQGKARIVIRTRFTYDPSLRVSDQRVGRISSEQRRSLDARFPELRGVPFEHRWAGALCLSRNHAPAFGEVEENLYSACCENGLGTVKSTLAGMMAADLATNSFSQDLENYRHQPKPSRIPPEPFAWLGINSVIRLQELRAGRER